MSGYGRKPRRHDYMPITKASFARPRRPSDTSATRAERRRSLDELLMLILEPPNAGAATSEDEKAS